MTLAAYKLSIKNARKFLEDGATINSLTKQYQPSSIFTIPMRGITKGQLVFRLRSRGAYDAQVTDDGTNYTITTVNPTAVSIILRELGVASDIQGNLYNDTHSQSPQIPLKQSNESYIQRAVTRLKTYLKKGR